MAIYHLTCDIVGRSAGKSATAVAAYRATCVIEDRTTGEKFDFTRKAAALATEILAPVGAPKWAKDRSDLWNSVEEKESRKNSQFLRSFEMALPKELDLATQKKLVELWARANYVSRGCVADIAIHGPHVFEDGTTNDNTHAHVLITTRKIDASGWTEKDREANDRDFLRKVRKSWADIVNAEFKRRGMKERIDERTLEEQGIDREPQQHMGPAATAIERGGGVPDRKRYKSQEQESQAAEVTAEELAAALADDEEFKALESERQEILKAAAKPSPEKEAEKKFELIEKNCGDRKSANDAINTLKREELFHYVQKNLDDELDYWESQKSKDWHDKGYNAGLEERKRDARAIAAAPQFDGEIYPTVDRYYTECSSIHVRMRDCGSHWDKIKNWIATTEFAPVKACRLAIEKAREWRDGLFPKKSQGRYYGRS